MRFNELTDFIKWENKRLNDHYGHTEDEKRTYIRTVKVAEEFGELCNEILAYNNNQRSDKLNNKNSKALGEEFADVIITTLLLAEHMKIDIGDVLKSKIKKIKERSY